MSYPTGGQWQQQQQAPPPPGGGGGPGQQPQQPPHYQPFPQQQQHFSGQQQQYDRGGMRAPYGYPPHGQPHQPPYGGAPYSGQPPPYGTPYPPYGSAQPYFAPRGPVQQSSATNSYNSNEAPVFRSGNSSSAPPPSTSGGGTHSYYGHQSGPTMSAHSHGSAPPVMQYPNQAHGGYVHRPPGGGMLKSVDEMFSQDELARRAFDHADREKTGYITFHEFLQSLQNLNIQMPYHDALHRFSKLDADKDGRVCETEYLNGYLRDKFGLVQARQ